MLLELLEDELLLEELLLDKLVDVELPEDELSTEEFPPEPVEDDEALELLDTAPTCRGTQWPSRQVWLARWQSAVSVQSWRHNPAPQLQPSAHSQSCAQV